MGVSDPNGGIKIMYPLFGISNQLIAAVALAIVCVMVIRKGYLKWVWIPAIPLVWGVCVTFAASWQKNLFYGCKYWVFCFLFSSEKSSRFRKIDRFIINQCASNHAKYDDSRNSVSNFLALRGHIISNLCR